MRGKTRNSSLPLLKFPVYWTQSDIDRTVEEITPTSKAALKKVVNNQTSLARRAEYYEHLLKAREIRDEVCGSLGGNILGTGSFTR